MDVTRISLEVPSDLHLKIKRLQLSREGDGNKITLKDLYIEILEKAMKE